MLLYLGAPQSTARYTIQTPIIYWTLVFGGRDRGPKAIIMWIEVPGPHPTPWCQQEPDSQKPQAVCRCGSWGTLRESHPWNTLRVATWKPAAQPHTAKSASCEATQLYKTVRVRVGCSCFAQKKHPHCRATPRSSEHFNTGIPLPKGVLPPNDGPSPRDRKFRRRHSSYLILCVHLVAFWSLHSGLQSKLGSLPKSLSNDYPKGHKWWKIPESFKTQTSPWSISPIKQLTTQHP